MVASGAMRWRDFSTTVIDDISRTSPKRTSAPNKANVNYVTSLLYWLSVLASFYQSISQFIKAKGPKGRLQVSK